MIAPMNPTEIYNLVLAAASTTKVRLPGSEERVRLGDGDCAAIAKEAERLFRERYGDTPPRTAR